MSKRVLVADIQRAVERSYRIDGKSLWGPSRYYEVSHPRQLAFYLARELTGKSYPNLGRLFGRDHSTVIHGVQQAKLRMQADRNLRRRAQRIKRRLAGDNSIPRAFCHDSTGA